MFVPQICPLKNHYNIAGKVDGGTVQILGPPKGTHIFHSTFFFTSLRRPGTWMDEVFYFWRWCFMKLLRRIINTIYEHIWVSTQK